MKEGEAIVIIVFLLMFGIYLVIEGDTTLKKISTGKAIVIDGSAYRCKMVKTSSGSNFSFASDGKYIDSTKRNR